MGFLTKLFSGKSEENAKPEEIKTTNSQPNTIYAPFKGTVIPLEQITQRKKLSMHLSMEKSLR